MKAWTLALLCVLAGVFPANAGEEKLRQALEKGIITGQFLQTLTPDDVPEKWKVRMETTEKDTYTSRVFSRGGVQVLRVVCSKDTKPGEEKSFSALLYHGAQRLAIVTRSRDSTTVLPADAPKDYTVVTTVKDDGTVTVSVLNEKAGYFESIVVKGRETHPIDDLDYTKAALAMEGITRPLMEALQGKLNQKPPPPPGK